MPKGEEHGDSNSRNYTVIRGCGYAETRARDERANGVPVSPNPRASSFSSAFPRRLNDYANDY